MRPSKTKVLVLLLDVARVSHGIKLPAVVVEEREAARALLASRAERATQNAAAALLQRCVRRWRARRGLQHATERKAALLAATIKAQALWRGLCQRRRYARTKKAAAMLQALVRRMAALEQMRAKRAAAVLIQSVLRCYMQRKRMEEERRVRRDAAAIVIQARLRGALARRQHLERQRAALMLQAVVKMYVARQAYRQKQAAAVMLQARLRGALARKRDRERRERAVLLQTAAVVVQARIRGALVRQRYLRRQNAVLVFQACARALKARRDLAHMRSSAVVIQQAYRTHLVEKRRKEKEEEERLERERYKDPGYHGNGQCHGVRVPRRVCARAAPCRATSCCSAPCRVAHCAGRERPGATGGQLASQRPRAASPSLPPAVCAGSETSSLRVLAGVWQCAVGVARRGTALTRAVSRRTSPVARWRHLHTLAHRPQAEEPARVPAEGKAPQGEPRPPPEDFEKRRHRRGERRRRVRGVAACCRFFSPVSFLLLNRGIKPAPLSPLPTTPSSYYPLFLSILSCPLFSLRLKYARMLHTHGSVTTVHARRRRRVFTFCTRVCHCVGRVAYARAVRRTQGILPPLLLAVIGAAFKSPPRCRDRTRI